MPRPIFNTVLLLNSETSWQAPSYASLNYDRRTHLLTGVKRRAASVARNWSFPRLLPWPKLWPRQWLWPWPWPASDHSRDPTPLKKVHPQYLNCFQFLFPIIPIDADVETCFSKFQSFRCSIQIWLPLKDFWWYNWWKLGGSVEWDWMDAYWHIFHPTPVPPNIVKWTLKLQHISDDDDELILSLNVILCLVLKQ